MVRTRDWRRITKPRWRPFAAKLTAAELRSNVVLARSSKHWDHKHFATIIIDRLHLDLDHWLSRLLPSLQQILGNFGSRTIHQIPADGQFTHQLLRL